MLDLHCCEAFPGRGYSPGVVCGLLTAAAALVAEHGLQGPWASVAAARELSSGCSQAPAHRLNSCGEGLVALWRGIFLN